MRRFISIFVLAAAVGSAQFAVFPDRAYWKEQWTRAPYDVEIDRVARIEDFVIDGNLTLSLDAFIELTMANNPDINLQKLAVFEAQNDIQRALSPFDAAVTTSFNATRATTPTTDILAGANVRSTLTQIGRVAYNQTFDTGSELEVSYTSNRRADNSSLVTVNPSLTQSMRFEITQPLLRGRGRGIQRIPYKIAQSRRGVSEGQAREQILRLIFQAENIYWNAVSGRERLKVQENNLELSRAFLERSRRELELGAISPLDIYQPEQQFATAQVGVTQARYQLQQADDAVRRQVGADLHPDLRLAPIILTEQAEPGSYVPPFDAEETISLALTLRPEVNQRRGSLRIDDLQIRQATNAMRPDLSLTASYQAQGQGGPFIDRSFVGEGPAMRIPGGLGDALDQLFSYHFPTYSMGLTLTLPMRNRRAAADLADAAIQKKRDLYQLRSIEQDIRLDVLQAIAGVEQSKASVQQATAARDFAQKRLDAEEKKYDLGVNTAFIVLDAQDDLVRAEADLVDQLIAYRRALLGLYNATGELLDRRGVQIKYD